MTVPAQPFPLPEKLPSPLASVHCYWNDLIRAENEIPFAGDVNLSRLPALAGNLLLIDVFAKPQRFRFNHLGQGLIHRLGENVTGRFADEVELQGPSNSSSRKQAPRSKRERLLGTPAGAATCVSCFRPGETAASSCYSAPSRSRGGGFAARRGRIRRCVASTYPEPALCIDDWHFRRSRKFA